MRRIIRKARRAVSIVRKAITCLSERLKNRGALYLVLTPEHNNLGDHAIAYAEKALFADWGLDLIEITGKELEERKRMNLLGLMNGRTILVHGGGYLGTLWFDAELLLRELIQKNYDSNILVLPNTMYYEDNDWGQTEFVKSIEIYNSHPKLTIYGREKTTFNAAKKAYNKIQVELMPDMVMSLNLSDKTFKREGCVLCLREDHERTRTYEQECEILNQVKSIFCDSFSYHDMCVNYQIPVSKREKELEKQFDVFRHAELVVTDRLHGMVFAAITGTPCVVLDSKSPKVRGCYEWISNLDYIRFCDDVRQISRIYYSMPRGNQRYDNSMLMPYFSQLQRDIMKSINRGGLLCHK